MTAFTVLPSLIHFQVNLQTIGAEGKTARYKINTTKLLTFLYISNKLANVILKRMPANNKKVPKCKKQSVRPLLRR